MLTERGAFTLHVAVSVDIDRFTDAQLRRQWLPMFAASGVSTVAKLREACAQMRAQGYAVFPSPDCTNRGPDGGCRGCPPKGAA